MIVNILRHLYTRRRRTGLTLAKVCIPFPSHMTQQLVGVAVLYPEVNLYRGALSASFQIA